MKGYRFSKDYERLFDMAMAGQIIVCFSDYDWTDGTILRDVCKTRRWGDTISISARGTIYMHAESKGDFINQCKKCHIEFLDPADTEELVEALRECVKQLNTCMTGYQKHANVNAVQGADIGESVLFQVFKEAIDNAEQLLKKYNDNPCKLGLYSYGDCKDCPHKIKEKETENISDEQLKNENKK